MQIVKYDKVVVSDMTDVPFIRDNDIVRLEAEITIIVPSTKDVKEQRPLNKIEMDDRVDSVRRYLSKLFGGYTSITGTGGYVMRSGGLVHENVVKVTSFGDKAIALRNRENLLKKLKK